MFVYGGSVTYLIWLQCKFQYYLIGVFHFAEKQKKAKSLQAKKVCVFKRVCNFKNIFCIGNNISQEW